MKIKYSALVSDARGKLNGSVASKNRYGSYIRNKVTPVNPQTASQMAVRASLTTLSQAWRGLTQAERDAWNAAVANFQKTNIFGDIVTPSGINLYMRLNRNLANIGVAPLDVPPVPQEVAGIVISDLIINTTTDIYQVTTDIAAVPAGYKLVIEATAPFSAGKSFVKNKYRVINNDGTIAANTCEFSAEYQAKFGLIATGEKIAVRLKLTKADAGLTSQYSSLQGIGEAL